MTSLELTPGLHQQVFAQRDQRYTIAIPEGYTGEAATPLILALHWGGMVTPFYGRGVLEGLIEPALRELGAIIAAPDCQHGQWANPESEAEVLALLDYLQEQYNLDADKTVLTGYSLGGMGTWYLAARNQDQFSAAVILAGRPQPDSAETDWDIPLYVIHSRVDDVVPLAQTDEVVAQLKGKGAAIEYVLLDEVTHYDAGGFFPALQGAVPWIRGIWEEK